MSPILLYAETDTYTKLQGAEEEIVHGKWMYVTEVCHPGRRLGGQGRTGTEGQQTPHAHEHTTRPVIPTGGRCSRAGRGAGGAMEEQEQRDEAAEERQERGAAGGGGGEAAAAAKLPQGDAAGRLHGS